MAYIDSERNEVVALRGGVLLNPAADWGAVFGMSANRAGDRFVVSAQSSGHWRYPGSLRVFEIAGRTCTPRLWWSGDASESAWAPDGHRFVVDWHPHYEAAANVPYEHYGPSTSGVYIVDLSTAVPTSTRIVDGPVRDLSWHPSGWSITYTTEEDDIAFIPATGGTPTVLIGGPDREHDAAWSPDGRHIAFVRGSQLFIADGDGTNQHHQPVGPGRDLSPVGLLPDEVREEQGYYDFRDPRDLAWTPDGKHLLVAVGGADTVQDQVLGASKEPGIWSVEVGTYFARQLRDGSYLQNPVPLREINGGCQPRPPAWDV